MKAILFAGVAALLVVFVAATNPSDGPPKKEDLNVAVFDLGTIKLKRNVKKVKKVFKIYNSSTQELRIKSVCSPCNSAVPIWTKSKIKPGKYGLIMVIYYPEAEGPFEASLHVNYYNADQLLNENLTKSILIKGSLDLVNPHK